MPGGAAVVPEDGGDLWADAARDARDLRAALEARGFAPVIADSPRRCGLRSWQRAVNFVVKTVRLRIEPDFGTLKRAYGLVQARCATLARNIVDITLKALVFNLCCTITLADAG